MKLFRQDGKIKTDLKLVSLHIPKTAGTSFRNVLQEVYGRSHIARLDIRRNIELNKKAFTGKRLKPEIQVIHGHFSYQKLMDAFEIPAGTPIITWLREPASRVISNYYYLDMILHKELNEEKKGLNILAKMQKSLLEFAHSDINRNRMSKFLSGISPEELFFIGLTEHYNEDVERLAQLMQWKEYPIYKVNITDDKPVVDQETIEIIKELNAEDYKIYNKALQLREEQMK
ncbi:MAG: sulfotransferase family 2 domain-containing protein [Bacteroidota bacterium]|nr:sulfotransferase family 2 domain-containing protein [Bacteroidota bacterium]